MSTILLLEDDTIIQELVKFNLEREGFEVLIADDGRIGLEMVKKRKPDLILLDLMLPEIDGYQVCRILRADEVTVDLPIIILSARGEEVDKVIGLELGADDYVTKPFSTRELLARIRARLREERRSRINESDESKIVWGELEIWPHSYVVTLSGKPINLTVKEFQVLHMLVTHPYQVFSREHLLEKIWGYSVNGDTRTVDVHISTLRAKLKPLGSILESVRGIGYRFTSPVGGGKE
ncbi:MAG: response regulator transcription factor [Desulfitobacteriaceae bacterium]|nr:response regulator transcription factor [Desulfitobacteriaceae bacterium]MDI6913611.1 response regulator transcription factor [Desulfitobacteriaceae bacterium]